MDSSGRLTGRRGVASLDGHYRFGERIAHLTIDSSNNAEIDERYNLARQYQDVAWMGIGVEQSVDQDLFENRVRATLSDELRIQACRRLGAHGRHLDTVQEFHRQDGWRAQRPADSRETDGWIVGELRGDSFDEAPLADKILLATNRSRKLGDQLAQTVQAGIRQVTFGQTGEVRQDGEIGFDHPLDSRPADLDRDQLARRQRRPVHLSDRRRGEWFRIELQEDVADAVAESIFNRLLRNPWLKRRHRILQPCQLRDDLWREEVRSRAECLAELDERRTEFFEREPQASRAARFGMPTATED